MMAAMIQVVTHNGGFHSDDVFAVAALQLLLGKENIAVTRTRDEAVIAAADWVVDVGGVFDAKAKRFDHHQNGAPVRENGIPYAALGLVWQALGEEVSGGREAAALIEERLVLPIDAGDNGINLYTLTGTVAPFEVQSVINLHSPVWDSDGDEDAAFMEAVETARMILSRFVTHATAQVAAAAYAKECYEAAADKRVVVCEKRISKNHFTEFSEVLFVVSPSENTDDATWRATAVPVSKSSFASRQPFPESWRGLRDRALADVSGIDDALFTHKSGFLFVAGSKEGAWGAVKKNLLKNI